MVAFAGGLDDWRLQMNHAVESQRAGNLAEARTAFEGAVASARKLGGESPPLGTALEYLSNFYDDVGNFGEAELTLKTSLSVWQRLVGSNNIALARIIRRMATIYIERGDFARAVTCIILLSQWNCIAKHWTSSKPAEAMIPRKRLS
jgi:hypothetical protein